MIGACSLIFRAAQALLSLYALPPISSPLPFWETEESGTIIMSKLVSDASATPAPRRGTVGHAFE